MKILRGDSENFLDTRKRGALKKWRGGGSKNVYTSKRTGGGLSLKFQASSFNIFISPVK